MKRLLSTAFATMASLAVIASANAAQPMQFKLTQQNGTGETATATLLQEPDNVLLVTVRTRNSTDDVQPVHIHKGTCDNLDPKPLYPLTALKDGISQTKLKDVKLSDLTSGNYAINIHKSTTNIATYAACGNLKVAKDAKDAK